MLPKEELIMSKEDQNIMENLKTEDETSELNSDACSMISDSSVQSSASSNTDIYDICGYIGPTLVCTEESDSGQSYLEVLTTFVLFPFE